MAGHSQFANIMHRKGAQDAKKAKMFTKVTREIISAAKGGAPDPTTNPRLRTAVAWAREVNMPRDRIEAAIKRGSGNADSDNFEEVRYEGYGPGGVAVIIHGLTDNRNRTAPDVRSAFAKHGGNMGESNSVSFMFDYVGMIVFTAKVASEDRMLEAAIEAGADNCESSAEAHIITTATDQLGTVREALEKHFGAPESAKFTWLPKNSSPVTEEQGMQLLKLVDVLEDFDDVQEVFTNVELPESLLAKLNS